MKVTLLAYTPEPDALVAAAARVCYGADAIPHEKPAADSVEKFINMLTEMGHESPVEHVSFTFGIEGVSRSVLAQITRHRIASFSVRSQRYVSEDEFGYVTPPEIAAIPEAAEIYKRSMERAAEDYRQLSEVLRKAKAERGDFAQKSEKAAAKAIEKASIEDARYVLPNACETMMVVTMNARSLYNFFRLRCCNRAQWEIRELARQMLMLVREVSPALFRKAGPPCLNGACPEGKMSCGKAEEMRKLYTAKEQSNG